MQVRFFTIPVHTGEEATDELNRFLAGHRILSVDRQLVQDGANSAWTLCVSVEPAGQGRPQQSQRSKVDYREVLNDADFAVYARLRSLRKTLAEADGVPVYALFTNEHLAEMVTRRVASISALREIPGVGKARADKYASLSHPRPQAAHHPCSLFPRAGTPSCADGPCRSGPRSGLGRRYLLLEGCRVRGLVRYMDDLVWWGDTRDQVRAALAATQADTAVRLQLEIKTPVQVGRSRHGLLFCGYRILPGRLLLSRRRKRRYAECRQDWEDAYSNGLIDERTLQAGYATAHAITVHADAAAWRREQLRRRPLAETLAAV